MKFVITFVNIFLFVFIFYTFFDKINTITEPLDKNSGDSKGCKKNDKDLVYKQEAKITGLFDKMKEVETGMTILNDKSKKNSLDIKKNSLNLKSNSAKIQEKSNEKMKELDDL